MIRLSPHWQTLSHKTPKAQHHTKMPCFSLYCVFQVLGATNNGGWALGFFEQLPQLVPHTEAALIETGYPELANEVNKLIACFPPEVEFLANSDAYIDVLNFMENPNRKINNTALNAYSKQQRQAFNENYNNALESIETVQLNCYGDAYYETQWKPLFSYYDRHLGQIVWPI